MLSFSIYLVNNNNKEIDFTTGEKKISILNFQICFLKMSRKLRPTRSTQQIKEKQINFLLEDVEKNLEEYKKAIETKNKQLSDIKKILQGPKKSYDSVIKENQELRKYEENIKQRYQQYQQQQQRNYIDKER